MKKLEWNLNDLFENEDSFYHNVKQIKKELIEIEELDTTDITSKNLETLLNRHWKMKEVSDNILIYASLLYYKDVKNEVYIDRKKLAEELNNEVKERLKSIDRKIVELGKNEIERFKQENSNLAIYDLYFDNIFRLQKHIQDDETNMKIKEHTNLINEQLRTYNSLLSSMKYESIAMNDKEIEITSSNSGKYLSSRNRDVRKDTYFSINRAYHQRQESFANILHSIYKSRTEICHLEKHNSILEKVTFEENITPQIIETLIKCVNEHLYLIHDYLKIKSEFLEIQDPHLYDFGVPLDSNLKIKYSIEEAIEIIKNALKPLGEEYLKVVELLIEEGHIDAELDEKKHQAITFSWNTYSFMNFRGSYVDIKNMIHELGHIVNYYLSKQNQPYIYEDSTIALGRASFTDEIASITNEILLNKYLYENAKTEEERLFYLSKEVENYFTTIFKQTMYTEFENDLYKIVSDEEQLSPQILNEKYFTMQRKYYGEQIEYDDIGSIEWARLGHLYRWSYYPYKYATGLIMANIVVNSLLEDKTLSEEQYIAFLSAGSSMYTESLLKLLHIDLTNPDIIKNGFKTLENDIKIIKQMKI